MFFFFNDTATTEIYTLSLPDALPICPAAADGGGNLLVRVRQGGQAAERRRAVCRLRVRGHPRVEHLPEHTDQGEDARERERSEEHTSELQSLAYLVCRLLLVHK